MHKGNTQVMSAGRNISDAFVFSCPFIHDYKKKTESLRYVVLDRSLFLRPVWLYRIYCTGIAKGEITCFLYFSRKG